MLMFIAMLFVIAKIWKQPKYPLAEWIKKMVYVYTNKILHTHTHNLKKEGNPALVATWMDVEGVK